MRRFYSTSTFFLLAVLFVLANGLVAVLLGKARIDLTEDKLYSLSEGTKRIIDSIDEPVQFYFFFSDKATVDNPRVRGYARRVRELLEEYASRGGDRLNLRVVDPEPFSEAEEQASQLGVQAAQANAGGESIYFGLVAVDSLDRHRTIPFFDAKRETALEYEVSRLLYTLLNPEKPSVGIISSVDMKEGGVTGNRLQPAAWSILNYIRQSFTTRMLDEELKELPKEDVLMVVRPEYLSDSTLYFIDQYVLGGGKALVFTDPAHSSPGEQEKFVYPTETKFNDMLAGWGITLEPGMLAGDPSFALQISSGGSSQSHPAYMGLTGDAISADDIVTAQLDTINVGGAGFFTFDEEPPVDDDGEVEPMPTIETLFGTSENGGGIRLQWLQIPDSALIRRQMKRSGFAGALPIAVRISGPIKAGFEEAPPGTLTYTFKHAETNDDANLIVVADVDMITDQFWVRAQNFLGRIFTSATADNGSFVQNALENLSGSSELISVRSRGKFSRPFTKVEEIRRQADENYRSRSDELEKKLRDTENELRTLQNEANEDKENRQLLQSEKQRTLKKFKRERTRIRKELRQVRHQLNKDIDSLNTRLRFVNIVAAPLFLMGLLLGGYHVHQRVTLKRRRLSR